jgi:FKBP-type peptidyl-prolyl cis-trans isomerase FklB
MKNISFLVVVLIALISMQSCDRLPFKSSKPSNTADSASYMIGISVGHNLKTSKMPDVNAELIAQGIKEVLENDSALSMQEANMYLSSYFNDLREQISKENIEKGKKFLEDNKRKSGVTETPSGLQYKVIQEGTGKSPLATDQVKCHYRGRLLDGEQFDSSYDRGQPAEFPVQGVIPGWTEGLQLMKEGGKYELYVPSELAYGIRGGGQTIGPNETLIFEIELLEVSTPTSMPGGMNRGNSPR